MHAGGLDGTAVESVIDLWDDLPPSVEHWLAAESVNVLRMLAAVAKSSDYIRGEEVAAGYDVGTNKRGWNDGESLLNIWLAQRTASDGHS